MLPIVTCESVSCTPQLSEAAWLLVRKMSKVMVAVAAAASDLDCAGTCITVELQSTTWQHLTVSLTIRSTAT